MHGVAMKNWIQWKIHIREFVWAFEVISIFILDPLNICTVIFTVSIIVLFYVIYASSLHLSIEPQNIGHWLNYDHCNTISNSVMWLGNFPDKFLYSVCVCGWLPITRRSPIFGTSLNFNLLTQNECIHTGTGSELWFLTWLMNTGCFIYLQHKDTHWHIQYSGKKKKQQQQNHIPSNKVE